NHHAAAAVAAAARDLLTLLKPGGDLVVEHKAAVDLEGLHGLGVFAPSVTGAAELTRLELSEQSYNALGLVKDTEWVSLVFEDLKNLLEPLNKVVAEFVNDTGATGREDRTAVAQLVLSVHRAFVKLERALLDARQELTDI